MKTVWGSLRQAPEASDEAGIHGAVSSDRADGTFNQLPWYVFE